MPAPLALTMGEPAGIGPELAAMAWARRGDGIPPFLLIGSADVMASRCPDVPLARVDGPEAAVAAFASALPILDIPAGEVVAGSPSPASANMVTGAIETAVAVVTSGRATAVVTCPIQKETLQKAGFPFPGHTEYLAHLAGRPTSDAVMMLAGPGLRVVPATIHIPLADVPKRLTTAGLVHVGRTVAQDLKARFGIENPRLVFAGLNPHAGEGGMLGLEDAAVIAPAVAMLKDDGIDARGPLPADTMFHAEARATYDCAICAYHDQALIPLKTLAFHDGVNVTLGLPFVRTSPDHGTALDLAGTGKARPDSLIAALKLAEQLA